MATRASGWVGAGLLLAATALLRPPTRGGSTRPAGPTGKETPLAPRPRLKPSRRTAAGRVLIAVGFLALGIIVYGLTGPPPHVVALQFAGTAGGAWQIVCEQGGCVPGIEAYRDDVYADAALIVGYVVGLGLMGLVGSEYLGRGSSRRLAGMAAVAVAMGGAFDVVEDLCILGGLSSGRSADLWWTVAAGCSVIKVVLVGLGGIVALGGAAVVTRRFLARRTTPLPEASVVRADSTAGGRLPPQLERRSRQAAIAVSGGGIRSAVVTLGALQVLRERGHLREEDYLFSVSGGGYLAGAMRLAIQTKPKPNEDQPDHEPPPFAPGTPEVDHLRAHGHYIADGPVQWSVAIGVVLFNFVLSMFLLAMGAVAIGALIGLVYRAFPLALPGLESGFGTGSTSGIGYALAGGAGVSLLLWLITGAVEATRAAPAEGWQRAVRASVALTVAIAVVGVALPALAVATPWAISYLGAQFVALSGLAAGALTALFATGSGKKFPAIPEGALQKATKLLRPTWVWLVVVVLALAWLGLTLWAAVGVSSAPTLRPGVVSAALVAAVIVAAFVALTFDQTRASLHPFYRRRLNTAFAVRRIGGRAVPYEYSEPTPLDSYDEHRRGDGLPQLVLLASAQLADGGRTPAGLRAASYSFSGDWIGGPQVGYVKTHEMRRRAPNTYKQDLTLLGAMAISGAAFASAMGRESQPFQVLLAVSNARLGAWLPHPDWLAREATEPDWTRRRLPTRRRETYHLREILGRYRNDDPLLLVTDGGHYDNTAIVEALRHRCRTVIAIDSSGNPPAFADAVCDAITLARTELDVTVELTGTEALVPASAPDPFPADTLSMLADRFSHGAVVLGSITYPDEPFTGTLVLAETRLTADLPYEVRAYAARNKKFPHDSTTDQWFDHEQFDAYQALGAYLGAEAADALQGTGQ